MGPLCNILSDNILIEDRAGSHNGCVKFAKLGHDPS